MSMNKESINDLKQIIHSVFICGNTMYDLPEDLCEEFCNQIIEVLKVGTL
jgi:hypothetical protein